MQVQDYADMCDVLDNLSKRARALLESPENIHSAPEACIATRNNDDVMLVNLMIILYNTKNLR